MKWTTDGTVRCDDCQAPAAAFYWQCAGRLGKATLAEAVQAGLTMHLCAGHDSGVNRDVWRAYAANTKSGAPQ